MRHFLEIGYNGKDFSGWQVQPDKRTVQGDLNNALSTVLKEKIHCVGCGRTDAGVHAWQFFLHFDSENMPPENLPFKLNGMLGEDIAVHRMIKVEKDQHSRFDATSRTYHYNIHFNKDPFLAQWSYQCRYGQLNHSVMAEMVDMLADFKDFVPLSKRDDEQTTLCNIINTDLHQLANNRLQLEITANRFLRNMVRRIVGAMISIGRGKMTLKEFETAMKKGEALPINFLAPPQGLYLSRVSYPFGP